ncbi:RagB/SusD family nutrient uptake outer membrane protein [uncultured Bacteroides sp.]|uniref:RagB/SusD family nutrient uptake outer membrane protein n=1 Tax=uncultured Bacteroides sp. TaxID=162156 RepID=UPI0025DE81F4|nr:RagB/SusD family nutrient uptake outer membrane protein [uncultured Bacteroides sp.]
MKLDKYILSFFIAATALCMSSCSDFLDRSPQGQFTEDDNPNALVNGKIYNAYTMMRHFNITAGTPAFAIHCFRSEDSEKGSVASDASDIALMYDDFVYSATNGLLGSYWSQNYAIIYQCNDILDAIAKKETAGQTETEDLINKGEASFFRAYCYFNLVRAFGEVPLVTFKINDASEANIAKTTADKIYEQIDTDLTTAEKSLPETWSTEYTGRLTWGAARSLHARTYMMRNDWDNMYTASTEVIGSGLYNLNTPYDEIFTDEGENSGGSIFELQCTATAALPQSDIIGSTFCEVQGVRGADQWDLGWGFHMATTLMGEAFEPGDPRKDATLLYFRRLDTDPITPENTNKPYGESPVSPAMGAFFNKKAYTDPALRKEYTNKGYWVNIRLIRYADVLLMGAESANEKGLPGEAVDYLERVRARARGNNSNVLPKVTTTDQTELREAIRHERRVELGLEFDRFYDLVRWGIAKEVLHAAGKTNYQDKNALLPLPQSEIDRSKGVLIQNPNY